MSDWRPVECPRNKFLRPEARADDSGAASAEVKGTIGRARSECIMIQPSS